MAVHRFGICSSVWCRAKILDLDQAAFRSGCPHCSFYVRVLSNRNDLMTFETSIDKINMRIRAVYVSGQSDLGLSISQIECIMSASDVSKQCEYCASKRRKF